MGEPQRATNSDGAVALLSQWSHADGDSGPCWQGGQRGAGEAADPDAALAARRDRGLEAWDPFLTLICYVLVIYSNLLGAVIR